MLRLPTWWVTGRGLNPVWTVSLSTTLCHILGLWRWGSVLIIHSPCPCERVTLLISRTPVPPGQVTFPSLRIVTTSTGLGGLRRIKGAWATWYCVPSVPGSYRPMSSPTPSPTPSEPSSEIVQLCSMTVSLWIPGSGWWLSPPASHTLPGNLSLLLNYPWVTEWTEAGGSHYFRCLPMSYVRVLRVGLFPGEWPAFPVWLRLKAFSGWGAFRLKPRQSQTNRDGWSPWIPVSLEQTTPSQLNMWNRKDPELCCPWKQLVLCWLILWSRLLVCRNSAKEEALVRAVLLSCSD